MGEYEGDFDVVTKERLKVARSTHSEVEFDWMVNNRRGYVNVISEGDSWFDYPREHMMVFGPASSIIDNLELLTRRMNLLRLARAGDEVVNMLVRKRNLDNLEDLFDKYGQNLNYFLFSGGGNDIVGEHLLKVLKPKTDSMTWDQCIDEDNLRKMIAEIETGYRNLIGIRDKHAPTCKIITHAYSNPYPTGQGSVFLGGFIQTGSWIKPYMEELKIDNALDQREIIKRILADFADMLFRVRDSDKSRIGSFVVLDFRNSINQNAWINELHLSPQALHQIAMEFAKAMRLI